MFPYNGQVGKIKRSLHVKLQASLTWPLPFSFPAISLKVPRVQSTMDIISQGAQSWSSVYRQERQVKEKIIHRLWGQKPGSTTFKTT